MTTKKAPADRPSGSRPSREGSEPQAQQSSRSTPRDQAIERMGPHLRAEFEQLARSESKIVKALARPETARMLSAIPSPRSRESASPSRPSSSSALRRQRARGPTAHPSRPSHSACLTAG